MVWRPKPAIFRFRLTAAKAGDRAAEFAGEGAVLIEYGAGAGVKTELMLEAFRMPRGYMPIDIAEDFLLETARRLASRFPAVWVRPVACDFVRNFDLPTGIPTGRRIGFFPGSTIGNLDETDAAAFLLQMRRHVGPGGGAVVGNRCVART